MEEGPGPSPLRWLLLPGAGLLVGIGVFVTGGVITDDEQIAKGLTVAWFAVAGFVAVAISWRHRRVAPPVLLGYVLSVVGLGGFLLYTSSVDRVVDEDVVVAGGSTRTPDPGGTPDGTQASERDPDANKLVVRGTFTDGEHPTDGVASVVMTPDRHVLTLTMFVTDPGPDLRVYLVAPGTRVTEGVDLGGLKGNKGDQQYVIPEDITRPTLDNASVVIWCRAFSVAFGTAKLKA